MPTNERWLQAFQFGAVLGLLQLLILLPQARPLNRLVLAGNLYLILGGIAVFLQQWWVLQLYGELKEAGIILLMLIVGVLSLFTRSGFVAISTKSKKYSLFLLFATLLMLPVAIFFEGNRYLAAVVPIVSLAVFNHYLISLAIKRSRE